MKINNLPLLLLFAGALFLTSCKKDDDGCTRCTLNNPVPLSKDCVVTICDDGSHTDNDAILCLTSDAILLDTESMEEKIEELTDLGFSCR